MVLHIMERMLFVRKQNQKEAESGVILSGVWRKNAPKLNA